MQKKLLVSAITLALGVAAGNASAVVDLDNDTAVNQYYASEIDFEGGSAVGGAAINAAVTLGAGFAAGNTDVYPAFKVSCGTFSAAFEDGDLFTSPSGDVTLASKGQAGDSVVVFNVQPPTGGLPVSASVNLEFAAVSGGGTTDTNIDITSTAGSCTLTYRLYSTLGSATNWDDTPTSILKEASAPLFGFKSGLNFTAVPNNDPSTADVAYSFEQFTLGDQQPSGGLYGSHLGSITLADATNVYSATQGALSGLPAGSGTLIDVIGTDAQLIISGANGSPEGMAAVSGMFLTDNAACSGTHLFDATIDKTLGTATFDVGNIGGTYELCVTMDGSTTIPAVVYVATLDPGSDNLTANGSGGYLTAKIPTANITDVPAGEVDQNGTILQSTFTSGFNYQVSRFIFINRGTSDASITEVRKYANTGMEAFSPPADKTVIPAGARLAINAIDMPELGVTPGSLSAGFSGGVEFVVGAEDDNIEGSYQYKIVGSDVQTVVQMSRPVSHYGQ